MNKKRRTLKLMAQAQQNIQQEVSYTFYFDTIARDKSCIPADPKNQTNPVDLPVQLSRDKAAYSQLYLASLEMPKLAQYTVEQDWQTLYFSEGLQLRVDDTDDDCVRSFTVLQNGSPITAVLPAFLNPIASVTGPGTTTPVIAFTLAHGLEILGACSQDDPIRLISTNVVGAPALATSFTIIDPFTVQLNLPAPVVWTAPFGYLYAPSITSPNELVCKLNAAFDAVAPGEFRLSYDPTTSLFSFCVLRPNLGQVCFNGPAANCPPQIPSALSYCSQPYNNCRPPAQTNQDSVAISIQGSLCLSYIMGFGRCNSQLPIPNIAPYCVTGQSGFCACESHAVIPPGNYDAVGLGSALSLQLNRFYFNGGCASDPTKEETFVFNDSCGVCHSISIPYGLYSPVTFAQYLETQMNILDPGPGYVVEYSPTLGFCFSTTDGSNFSLEFSDPTISSDIPGRLGFTPNSFRGRSSYCSVLPVNVPLKNCCIDTAHYLNNIYEISVNNSTQQFSMNVTLPRAIPFVSIAAGPGPQEATICTGNAVAGTGFAHGFNVGDVVTVTTTAPATFQFKVVTVIDAFCFVVDLGSVPIGSLPLVGSCVSISEIPILNLYFGASPCQVNPIKPTLLSFLPEDVLYAPGSSSPLVVTGNTLFNLDQPPYVLLVVQFPGNLWTRNSHTNGKQDTIQYVLAKIILYPNFKIERIYPTSGFVQELNKATKLRLVLLNPDHTPYKFHNSDWSGTIVYLCPERQTFFGCV